MVNDPKRFPLLAAISSLLLVCGCGDSGGRQAIEGLVTIDGKPLKNGDIVFFPQPGTQGPTAGAQIRSGRFVIPAGAGTFAGKFRVEITATRPSGQKVADGGWLVFSIQPRHLRWERTWWA